MSLDSLFASRLHVTIEVSCKGYMLQLGVVVVTPKPQLDRPAEFK
jgi:hypothetical protein